MSLIFRIQNLGKPVFMFMKCLWNNNNKSDTKTKCEQLWSNSVCSAEAYTKVWDHPNRSAQLKSSKHKNHDKHGHDDVRAASIYEDDYVLTLDCWAPIMGKGGLWLSALGCM